MFTARVSAVYLICAIYPRLSQYKDKLRAKFVELAAEETPLIRKAISLKIGEFSSIMEKEAFFTDILKLFKALMDDDQDTIRSQTLESLKVICKSLQKEEIKTHIIPSTLPRSHPNSTLIFEGGSRHPGNSGQVMESQTLPCQELCAPCRNFRKGNR